MPAQRCTLSANASNSIRFGAAPSAAAPAVRPGSLHADAPPGGSNRHRTALGSGLIRCHDRVALVVRTVPKTTMPLSPPFLVRAPKGPVGGHASVEAGGRSPAPTDRRQNTQGATATVGTEMENQPARRAQCMTLGRHGRSPSRLTRPPSLPHLGDLRRGEPPRHATPPKGDNAALTKVLR